MMQMKKVLIVIFGWPILTILFIITMILELVNMIWELVMLPVEVFGEGRTSPPPTSQKQTPFTEDEVQIRTAWLRKTGRHGCPPWQRWAAGARKPAWSFWKRA